MWILNLINSIMNEEKRSPMALTEIKQAKILKQIIFTQYPYSPTFPPRYSFWILLKDSYINEKYSTKLDIEIEKKK